jgi:acetyl-CoA carboxylase biotin carboxyl carrier protein
LASPMGGTFYRKPAPGEPEFVKVGDKVKKCLTVCIIEAMKLMNEIEVSVLLVGAR